MTIPCSGTLVVTESLSIPTYSDEAASPSTATAEAPAATAFIDEGITPVSNVEELGALALQDGIFDPCSCDPLLDTAYAIYDGQFYYDGTLIHNAAKA